MMFNPFWSFGRTVTLTLPHTFDYFDVTDGDGTRTPWTDSSLHKAWFKNPNVSLTNRARQVLEICGIPWKLKVSDIANSSKKFVVYYSHREFNNTTMSGHSDDCAAEVLNTLKPFIIVRSSDFIKAEAAFADFIVMLESEKARTAVKSK